MQAVLLITDPAYDVIQVLGIAQDGDGGQWQDFLEECAVLREKEAMGGPEADGGSSAFRREDRVLQATT